MRRFSLAAALAVVFSLFALHGAEATTTIPKKDRVDVGSVKIANKAKKVVISFAYKQAPADGQWAADIKLDTNSGDKGPEFRISVTNSCGTGIDVFPTGAPGDPDWQSGGCGSTSGKCFKSYSVVWDENSYLRSITFQKVKGCVNTSKLRVTGEFRTLDLADRNARPFFDHIPGKKGVYTKWVRKGHARTFKDRT